MYMFWVSFALVFGSRLPIVFPLEDIVSSDVDPVTKALEYVEEIARQKDNCSFGPSLDLQYNQDRWTMQANVAVNTANLLTTFSRTGNHIRGIHPEDEDLLYSLVLANVQNHEDVFGSAIAFKTSFYRDYALFCPYAFRAPDPCDAITAKDLSIGYNYTMEETDWFHIPFKSFRNYTFGLSSAVTTSSTFQDNEFVFSSPESDIPCERCTGSSSLENTMGSLVNPTPTPGVAITSEEFSSPYALSTHSYYLSATELSTLGSQVATQIGLHNGTTDTTDPLKYITKDALVTDTPTTRIRNATAADIQSNVSEDLPLPSQSQVPVLDNMHFVDITDGYWTKPYFDCGGGDVWMVTFSVPFFWSNPASGSEFTFAGVTTIDISLDQLDIHQCALNDTGNSSEGKIFDPFVGTHRCKNTTQCLHVSGKGFQRGTYLCQCKRGYYFPPDAVSHADNTRSPAFLGSAIEEEYNKKAYGLENDYDSAFDCLPCQPGCDECDDDSPCLARPNITLRWCFLGANLICIILLVVLGIYTYRHREIRIFKAASPGLLYVILIGTGLSYCETIISIAAPIGLFSCQGLLWFRYLGFWLAYGALLFKTWRITKVFTVRSAKPVRITDRSLFLRICILLAIFVVFLVAWTFLGPSEGQQVRNQAGLKYFRCSQNAWNYASKAGELILLIWGMYLCFKVRKAPSAFNESRYISVSIYNEALISIFGAVVSFVIPAEFAGPDTFLIINFCRLHATFTVMVALLFLSKICMFYRTNTDKKKAESKKSQVVFTIDNSSVIIDFSHENPEVSDELGRLQQELVDIKELISLGLVNQSITSISKIQDIDVTSSLPDIPAYRSLRDVIAKDSNVQETGSGTSTPTFLKKGSKIRGRGSPKILLGSLPGSLASNSSPSRLLNMSYGSAEVKEGVVNRGIGEKFARIDSGVITDDIDENSDEVVAEVKQVSSRLCKERLHEEVVRRNSSPGRSFANQDVREAAVLPGESQDDKDASIALKHRIDPSSSKQFSHLGGDFEQESFSPLNIYASVIVDSILKDSINTAEQYTNNTSISSRDISGLQSPHL
ncbi:probable G-protein coupled receptor CG31760 [Lytechinus variegatus]|uniref:probable G-protein coupled receptor CG31760 n=1 Tax=Lytechinus variegatus TaxID=7654 RepID=UPI001BB22DDC|nr:probable G-protein coupled receptor CG31760 [Lytechinus variegatus]